VRSIPQNASAPGLVGLALGAEPELKRAFVAYRDQVFHKDHELPMAYAQLIAAAASLALGNYPGFCNHVRAAKEAGASTGEARELLGLVLLAAGPAPLACADTETVKRIEELITQTREDEQ
jgi:alkylhydroperoxidase/carboxymuconolactone decarboxylase family protein YurZ